MRSIYLLLFAMLCLGGAAYVWITGRAPQDTSNLTTLVPAASTDTAPSATNRVSNFIRQNTPLPPPEQPRSLDSSPSFDARPPEGQLDVVPPSDVFTIAVDAFDAGRYEEAEALFLEVANRDSRALSGAGLAAFKLRDWEGAVHHLRQAVEHGQNGFTEHKFLALAYNHMDDLDLSLYHADAALSHRTDHEMETLRARLRLEQEAREGFIAEETEHFRTLYDGYVHGTVNRRILDILEDAYRDIGSRLDFFPDGTITVVLYTERDFFDVTLLPVWTAGAFDGRIHLPVKGIEDADDPFLRTVLHHEYVHALVHRLAPGVPHWLNEGLADYLVDRGLPRTGQDISLRDLEQRFPMGDNKTMMLAYAVSYSAVAYLVEEYGLWRMRDFLMNMGRGRPLDEAFQDAFYTSYEDFLATWGRG